VLKLLFGLSSALKPPDDVLRDADDGFLSALLSPPKRFLGAPSSDFLKPPEAALRVRGEELFRG
jgi:hypothetical protein